MRPIGEEASAQVESDACAHASPCLHARAPRTAPHETARRMRRANASKPHSTAAAAARAASCNSAAARDGLCPAFKLGRMSSSHLSSRPRRAPPSTPQQPTPQQPSTPNRQTPFNQPTASNQPTPPLLLLPLRMPPLRNRPHRPLINLRARVQLTLLRRCWRHTHMSTRLMP